MKFLEVMKMGNKQNVFYKEYMDKLQEKAKQAVAEAQKEAFAEYFGVAEKKIQSIYHKVITNFYQSYEPLFYERRDGGSLYKLLQIKRDNNSLSMSFDPSKILYRDGYAESSFSPGIKGGLYDLVFRQGWHGGALVDGKMRYPVGTQDGLYKPYDGDKCNGKYQPYKDETYENITTFLWGKAHKTFPPLEEFRYEIDSYQKTEYQKDYNKIWDKHKSNIKLKM